MSQVPLWPRPRYRPSGRRAEVYLFAFADEPLSLEAELDPEEHGAPSTEALEAVRTALRTRAADPDWFDGLRAIAAPDRPSTAAVESSSVVYRIDSTAEDPRDLRHLQSAWAVARWLCAAGCTAVLDGGPIEWHAGADLLSLSPDRPFDLWREIRIVFEIEPSRGVGHVLHTRGMLKFARPDLLTIVPEFDRDRAVNLIRALAQAQALGHTLPLARIQMVRGVGRGRLEPYVPDENAPQVNLNNDGLVLVIEALDP